MVDGTAANLFGSDAARVRPLNGVNDECSLSTPPSRLPICVNSSPTDPNGDDLG